MMICKLLQIANCFDDETLRTILRWFTRFSCEPECGMARHSCSDPLLAINRIRTVMSRTYWCWTEPSDADKLTVVFVMLVLLGKLIPFPSCCWLSKCRSVLWGLLNARQFLWIFQWLPIHYMNETRNNQDFSGTGVGVDPKKMLLVASFLESSGIPIRCHASFWWMSHTLN